MRTIPLAMSLTSLLACGTTLSEQEELGQDLAMDYAAAACRLYTEEACALGEADSCGQDLGFDDAGDCETVLRVSFLAGTDELFPALYANEAVVWGCVDLLDAVDCSVEQPCGDDGYVLEQGDCAELNSIIAEHLPGWHPI